LLGLILRGEAARFVNALRGVAAQNQSPNRDQQEMLQKLFGDIGSLGKLFGDIGSKRRMGA
jgi:hypothetical protein